MASFPIKRLQADDKDFSDILTDVVKKFTDRAIKSNLRLAKGCLDAPCIESAIILGSEGINISSGAPSDPYEVPVFKINVPGYFYRQHYTDDWSTNTTAGVLLCSSPDDISNELTRVVYMAGSDGTIGHANNMFPILPGANTYAYIVRNSSMIPTAARRMWLFVPTVLGASINVLPEDYVSIVGGPKSLYTLTGTGGMTVLSKATEGDWRSSFKSVCGWNVVDENKITFMTDLKDPPKTRFIKNRIDWIKGLGARLSDYGYTDYEA